MYSREKDQFIHKLVNGGGGGSQFYCTPKRIDPIDPATAGRVKTKLIFDMYRGTADTEAWITKLKRTVHPDDQALSKRLQPGETWCGIAWHKRSEQEKSTKQDFKEVVEELALSILEKPSSTQGMILNGLFLVPKTEEVSRVILDCRPLNKMCGAPPHLSFATIADIFRMLNFSETTFTATADFRHWFYQLPLHTNLRDLFGIRCGDQTYRLKVWAMGFAWSPFVAQGISMTIAKIAIHLSTTHAERWWAIRPTTGDDTPPPFWMISRRAGHYSELSKEDIAGFVLFWYDNLLVITGRDEDRTRFLDNISTVTAKVNAQWKTKPDEQDRPYSTETDRTTFLGLDFRRQRRSWIWRHIDDNRSAWARLQQEPHTWKTAAKIIGTLTWDWFVSGSHRDNMLEVFTIMRRIGSMNLEGPSQWNAACPPRTSGGITREEWLAIKERLTNVCTKRWLPFGGNTLSGLPHSTKLASDAMETTGAAILLSSAQSPKPRILFVKHFTKTEQKEHINWKETETAICALETIWAIPAERRRGTLFHIGVDNTTALATLNAGCIPWSTTLNARLKLIRTALQEGGCFMLASYIPGKNQPADEPSRGMKMDNEKAYVCIETLSEIQKPWWTYYANEKRAREESETHGELE